MTIWKRRSFQSISMVNVKTRRLALNPLDVPTPTVLLSAEHLGLWFITTTNSSFLHSTQMLTFTTKSSLPDHLPTRKLKSLFLLLLTLVEGARFALCAPLRLPPPSRWHLVLSGNETKNRPNPSSVPCSISSIFFLLWLAEVVMMAGRTVSHFVAGKILSNPISSRSLDSMYTPQQH